MTELALRTSLDPPFEQTRTRTLIVHHSPRPPPSENDLFGFALLGPLVKSLDHVHRSSDLDMHLGGDFGIYSSGIFVRVK